MERTFTRLVGLIALLALAYRPTTLQAQSYSESLDSYPVRDSSFKFGYSYTNSNLSTTDALSGTSLRTSTLNLPASPALFTTGYIYLNGSETISFDHRVLNTSSSPSLSVQLVSISGSVTGPVYSHTYANTLTVPVTNLNLSGYTGWYKVRFRFSGSGGSSIAILDNISSSASAAANGKTTLLADLSTSASSDGELFNLNDTVTVTFTVTNNGPDAARGAVYTVYLPVGLEVASLSATNGTFDTTTHQFRLNNLNVSNQARLTLKMLSSLTGGYNVAAELTSFGLMEDPSPFNNAGGIYVEYNDPLPVTLLRFEARQQSGEARLAWVTAQEKNSAYFEVEYAADGKNYAPVGRVEAAGTSHSLRSYTFADRPLENQGYYRLRMVDQDGSYEYSPSRLLKGAGEKPRLSLWPNPSSTGEVMLESEGLDPAESRVRITNALGQEVAQVTPQGQPLQKLSLGHLPSGTYRVEVWNGAQGQTQTLVLR